jgi:hypothetical protein
VLTRDAEAGSLRLMPGPSQTYALAFCAASNTSRADVVLLPYQTLENDRLLLTSGSAITVLPDLDFRKVTVASLIQTSLCQQQLHNSGKQLL